MHIFRAHGGRVRSFVPSGQDPRSARPGITVPGTIPAQSRLFTSFIGVSIARMNFSQTGRAHDQDRHCSDIWLWEFKDHVVCVPGSGSVEGVLSQPPASCRARRPCPTRPERSRRKEPNRLIHADLSNRSSSMTLLKEAIVVKFSILV